MPGEWKVYVDGDGFPWGRVWTDGIGLAFEFHAVQEQAAEVTVAESGNVAQFDGAMEDFDGEPVVRVVGLGAERELGSRDQYGQLARAVVVAEAGDGEIVEEDLARRWRL